MNITKNINNLPKSQVDVQITIPWADAQTIWDQTMQKHAAEVEVPGFRKGQAPLEMVKSRILPTVQQEFMQTIMPQGLMEALQGTQVVPIDYPQYQLNSFSEGNPLTFTARVTQRPNIQVGNYKGVKAVRPTLKPITDEEVNKIIDDLYKRWKLKNPQGQSSVAIPQSSESQPAAPVGGGSMNFNQPSTPSSQTTATQAPASEGPDDVFAQSVGAQSLADLKQKIRLDLESEAKYNNELDYEEAILQEVEKITTVDIPEVLIQDELNRMLVSLQRQVTERGLLLDEYLKGQNKTVDQLKNEWKPQADKNVRMELGLSEVARLENVNIADDELQAEIDKIQDARVKQQFDQQEPRMHLRHALRQTKTLNLLKTLVG